MWALLGSIQLHKTYLVAKYPIMFDPISPTQFFLYWHRPTQMKAKTWHFNVVSITLSQIERAWTTTRVISPVLFLKHIRLQWWSNDYIQQNWLGHIVILRHVKEESWERRWFIRWSFVFLATTKSQGACDKLHLTHLKFSFSFTIMHCCPGKL